MAMVINGVAVAVSMAAVDAAGGGVIDVPVGTWDGFFDLACGNVWFRGEHKRASVMRMVPAAGEDFIIRANAGTWYRDIRFTDICFDGNDLATANIVIDGAATDEWLFERCRFINFVGFGFLAGQMRKCRFVQCEFVGDGDAVGEAVQFTGGCYDVTFEDCTVEWTQGGFTIDSGVDGEIPGSRILVDGCRFRFDYWAIKQFDDPAATGSGGTVTYTANTLTDTAKNWAVIPALIGRTIRALPVLAAGNLAAAGNLVLDDNTKDFRAMGLVFGDLIRTATAWTQVIATDAADGTKIYIDGWRDLVTYDDVAPPTGGTAYTLYRLVLGTWSSQPFNDSINVDRWRNLLGETVATPAAGTLYEWGGNLSSSGGVHFESGCDKVEIACSWFQGAWGDQITVGSRAIVRDVYAYYGQDGNCTLEDAVASSVLGGRFGFAGSANIFLADSQKCEVVDAYCQDAGTVFIALPFTGDIHIDTADQCSVRGCTLERTVSPQDYYGVTLRGGSIDPRIFDNKMIGHVSGQVYYDNASGGATGTRRRDNDTP